jgi:cell division septal protein FtsQ
METRVLKGFRCRDDEAGFARLSFVALSSVLVLATLLAGRSPHFDLKTIEVRNLPENSPVSADELIALSGLQVEADALIYLPLSRVSSRIHEEPWVKSVHIEKVPPSSLVLEVQLKNPVAVFQGQKGELRWVDESGELFGMVDPSRTGHQNALDLPMISGLDASVDRSKLADAASFLVNWKQVLQTDGNLKAELSSLSYSEKKGWRGWLSYSVDDRQKQTSGRARMSVDLGATLDSADGEASRLNRIRSVLSYIRDRGILARHLFADGDKKIVVKLASDS